MVVSVVALRWRDVQGRGRVRVKAHTPQGCKCVCWMGPHCGMLGFRPITLPNAKLGSAEVRAQESFPVWHFSLRSSHWFLVFPWLWDGGLYKGWAQCRVLPSPSHWAADELFTSTLTFFWLLLHRSELTAAFWGASYYLCLEKCFIIGFYAFSKFFLKIFLACPYSGYYISQAYFALHSSFLLWKLFHFCWISLSSSNFFHS